MASYFRNISGTTAGLTIKQNGGCLKRVCLNTKPGTSGVLTIYDNVAASGTKIATMDIFNMNGPFMDFDVPFSLGLTVVVTNGSGTSDLTIIYE